MYYEIFQDREKVLWGRIHAVKPQVAVFLHSCGGIYELDPGLIDADLISEPGADQPRGYGSGRRLKRNLADRLCFWGGGCDTQTVRPLLLLKRSTGIPGQNIRDFKPGGGVCFSAVPTSRPACRPQNIAAMRQAVHDSWGDS